MSILHILTTTLPKATRSTWKTGALTKGKAVVVHCSKWWDFEVVGFSSFDSNLIHQLMRREILDTRLGYLGSAQAAWPYLLRNPPHDAEGPHLEHAHRLINTTTHTN